MQHFIHKYAFKCAAFDKQQATITEESEDDASDARVAQEVELPRIGQLSCLYHS